jgi:hypothetical protein
MIPVMTAAALQAAMEMAIPLRLILHQMTAVKAVIQIMVMEITKTALTAAIRDKAMADLTAKRTLPAMLTMKSAMATMATATAMATTEMETIN